MRLSELSHFAGDPSPLCPFQELLCDDKAPACRGWAPGCSPGGQLPGGGEIPVATLQAV